MIVESLAFGALAGMRSMSAPALFSNAVAETAAGRALPLGSARAAEVLRWMAIGEWIADKLPFVPARTVLPSLLVRTASGAFAGGEAARIFHGSAAAGAVLGGAGAIVATHLAYRLRRALRTKLHLPDFAVALAEDGIVVVCAGALRDHLRAELAQDGAGIGASPAAEPVR